MTPQIYVFSNCPFLWNNVLTMCIKLFELGKLIPYVDLDLEVHRYHKRSDVKGCVTPVLQILHDSSLLTQQTCCSNQNRFSNSTVYYYSVHGNHNKPWTPFLRLEKKVQLTYETYHVWTKTKQYSKRSCLSISSWRSCRYVNFFIIYFLISSNQVTKVKFMLHTWLLTSILNECTRNIQFHNQNPNDQINPYFIMLTQINLN